MNLVNFQILVEYEDRGDGVYAFGTENMDAKADEILEVSENNSYSKAIVDALQNERLNGAELLSLAALGLYHRAQVLKAKKTQSLFGDAFLSVLKKCQKMA